MGLLSLAGAISGAGEGAGKALQTAQTGWTQQMLMDERAKLDEARDQRLEGYASEREQRQYTHAENLAQGQQAHAEELQRGELAARAAEADLERTNRAIEASNERSFKRGDRTATQSEIVKTVTGNDGKEYGVTKDGRTVALGITAPTPNAKIKETQIDADGKLIAIMDDGTVKDLQRTVPKVDKVKDTITDATGNLWALTESGQKTSLGLKAQSKTETPKVHSIETDEKTGQQFAIMEDGSKKAIGLTGTVKAAQTKDLPESTKQTVLFLEKRIAAIEKLAADPLIEPEKAKEYQQQIADLSQQAMNLLGHGKAKTGQPTSNMDLISSADPFRKTSQPTPPPAPTVQPSVTPFTPGMIAIEPRSKPKSRLERTMPAYTSEEQQQYLNR